MGVVVLRFNRATDRQETAMFHALVLEAGVADEDATLCLILATHFVKRYVPGASEL